MQKKVVVVLLLIAIVLSIFSISVAISDSGTEEVNEVVGGETQQSAEIGITIAPPATGSE